MKNRFLKTAWPTVAAVAVAGMLHIPARAADPSGENTAQAALTEKRPAHRLTGAELYSIHCARCHAERYPTERTAAQWKTIVLHMRVRANLPAEHARMILKYLQDNSGR